MGRNIIRFSVFAAVNFLLLISMSQIYKNKESANTQDIAQFYNEPKNSIDVLIFGTSKSGNAFHPPVFWSEQGVTVYNLNSEGQTSPVSYYLLKEALNYQTPSAVVLDGSHLFRGREEMFDLEANYRRSLDPMRLSINKLEAIKDVVSHDKSQSALDYIFPFLRYHERDILDSRDFDFLTGRSSDMGAEIVNAIYSADMPEDFMSDGYKDSFELNDEYTRKAIDLCKENNIPVVLTVYPEISNERWSKAKHEAILKYAEENGVDVVDYNMPDLREIIGFDENTDFIDPDGHVNASGGYKISAHFARYMAEKYNLRDKRDTITDAHWDNVEANYNALYWSYIYINRSFDEIFNAIFEASLPQYTLGEKEYFTDKASVYQFGGWSAPEGFGTWMEGESAALALSLESGVSSGLALHLEVSSVFNSNPIDIYVSGVPTGSYEFTVGDNIIKIPETLYSGDKIVLQFKFKDIISPADLGQSDDARKLAIGIESFYMEEDYSNDEETQKNGFLPSYEFGHEIDFRTESEFKYAGWSGPEDWGAWTDSEEAVIAMNIKGQNGLRMHLNVSNIYNHNPVSVYVNEIKLGDYELFIGDNVIDIPKALYPGEELVIEFQFNGLQSPKDLGQSDDERKLGIGVTSLYIEELIL